MNLTRRRFVQGLSLTPLISVGSLATLGVESYASSSAHVNVLLHGLFFMKFESGKLVAKSPVYANHTFCTVSGGTLVDLSSIPKIDIDLSLDRSGLGNTGTDNSFSNHPQIPQIPQSAIGDWNDSYKIKITLPLPETIIPLRAGGLADFKKMALGKIAKSIADACSNGGTNTDFAIITCLRYSKKKAFGAPKNSTMSFYAEHWQPPAVGETNHALDTANKSLFTKQGFDLSFRDEFPPVEIPPVCRDRRPGYGIHTDDENSLAEINAGASCSHGIRGTDVANCVQFGIRP